MADIDKFRIEINHLLEKGVVVPVENNERSLYLFNFPYTKKDNRVCLILNLQKLNRYVN